MEIRSLRFQEREIERKRLRYKEKYLNTVHVLVTVIRYSEKDRFESSDR